MNIEKLLGFGLVLGGGYFILEKMGMIPCMFNCSATVTTTATTTSPQASPTVNMSGDTLAQIITKMSAASDNPNNYHTVYGWNYYFQQVRGIPGPDPSVLFPADPNASTKAYSIQEWWAAMTKNGFSGMRGMGIIAHGFNPYHNPMGRPFGSYLVPLASEMVIKRPTN